MAARGRDERFADRYGRWAVIAGGSDGIGAAFAWEAARRGLARSADVFCDEGAYTVDEARDVLAGAKAAGRARRSSTESSGSGI